MNSCQTILNRSIIVSAPVSVVWKTLTDPEQIKKWISDDDVTIYCDWQPGSTISFKGDIHGMSYESKGKILQLEKEKIVEYTYLNSISDFRDIPENRSVIRFELTQDDNATLLSLQQSNFVTEVNFKHFEFYWKVTLNLLKKIAEHQNES